MENFNCFDDRNQSTQFDDNSCKRYSRNEGHYKENCCNCSCANCPPGPRGPAGPQGPVGP